MKFTFSAKERIIKEDPVDGDPAFLAAETLNTALGITKKTNDHHHARADEKPNDSPVTLKNQTTPVDDSATYKKALAAAETKVKKNPKSASAWLHEPYRD